MSRPDGSERNKRYLDESEVASLLSSVTSLRERVLVHLLYALGCSLQELVRIRVRDIDLEGCSVQISSSPARSSRRAYFSRQTRDLLEQYLENQGVRSRRLAFIFGSRERSHMTVRRAAQLITGLLREAGFTDRDHPQVLKYSHIVNAYRAHVPVSAIQRQVGLTKQRLIAILSEIDESQGASYEEFFTQIGYNVH